MNISKLRHGNSGNVTFITLTKTLCSKAVMEQWNIQYTDIQSKYVLASPNRGISS